MAKQGYFGWKSWGHPLNTDDDSWYADDWDEGGKDTKKFDPSDHERNKGKMGFMPEGWTEEQRKKVDHVTCPDCSATVYASGYMVRDKCDVCWAKFPDTSWDMPESAEAAKNNKSSQGTHSTYSGSYSRSLTSFSKLTRSKVEMTDSKKDHLLSRVNMEPMPDRRWQDNVSAGKSWDAVRDETKHVTKQHKKTKTDADEYLSSTSEAYTHEIVQDIELFTRAVELALEAKSPPEKMQGGQDEADKQADLRRMVEVMMGEFGAAVGHKIGDDWFLRDTTEEARAIQERATSANDQPMYGAALYGDEGDSTLTEQTQAHKSAHFASNPDSVHPDTHHAQSMFREKIRRGIKKADVAEKLNDVATEVAKAKNEDRMKIMQERLMPLISEIIEQEGGEALDEDQANEAIGEAMGGMAMNDEGKETDERANPSGNADSNDEYKQTMRNYMNGVGDEIRKEREELAKKKGREDKWSPSAKNIANAYGHEASNGYSIFDSREPLLEFTSRTPKTVPLTFKAQQMLEAIENQRRITWEESGDATDRMVELNFGNLKVFRQEDTFAPQLIIGVDVSGSTGCIHNAGHGAESSDIGSLMWEIAATVSSAGGETNTLQYAYHSTGAGFLTAIEVPRGMRPICNCEAGDNIDYYGTDPANAPEHGGGTPELAMLTYLNDKAQQKGELESTTVILIVDGKPDDPEACKKMSEELVKAGVQFGVVICGKGNYWNRDEVDTDYYSASVGVKVRTSADIDTAIPKLMSLIRERGLA